MKAAARQLAIEDRAERNSAVRDAYKSEVREAMGGLRCEFCGWSAPQGLGWEDVIHVHHIVPLAYGGPDARPNLIALCPNHHALAHKIWHVFATGSRTPAAGFDRETLISHLHEIEQHLADWKLWHAAWRHRDAFERRRASRSARKEFARGVVALLDGTLSDGAVP